MLKPVCLSPKALCIAVGLFLLVLSGCSPAPTIQPQVTSALPTAVQSPIFSLPTPNIIVATNPPPTPIPSDTAVLPSSTLAPSATATPLPTQPPVIVGSGPYAVVNVAENSVLVVHETPDANSAKVVALKYNDTGLKRTGQSRQVGDDLWWEITLPDGRKGWVNSAFLTEQVEISAFCADERVKTLLANLKQAYNTADGALYSSLVSPRHGLDLTYMHTGRTANYNTEEAKFVFTSTYVMNWGVHPAAGLDVQGTFHEEVLPKLVEVLNSNYTLTCNDPGPGATNYVMAWPDRYANVRYMALFKPGTPGIDLDWKVWLIGFEYIDGKPALFSMIYFFWEP